MENSKSNSISRRTVLQRSMLGVLGLTIPMSAYAGLSNRKTMSTKPYPAYPSLDPDMVGEVVGKSHFDLKRVKELVEQRPELAAATWEWRFGDFESAIGAASHVGRRDIVEYLLSKGARPNIFTYTVLGAHEAVKGMISYSPGIQRTLGPHGISLLDHAYAGLRMKDSMNKSQLDNSKRLIDYLEELGDANGKEYEDVSEEDKPKYLGDYMYGDQQDEGFSIKLNMRKMLSLGAIGEFGGALYKLSDNHFTYNGAPSVKVTFQWENETIKSLTVKTPDSEILAKKL